MNIRKMVVLRSTTIVAIVCAASMNALAGKESSDGTRGGGQVVRDGAKLSLRDFKDSTVCRWQSGVDWRDSPAMKVQLREILGSVAETHWYFARELENTAKKINICWTGRLKPISYDDQEDVGVVSVRSEQIAVFIFSDRAIYIDRELLTEARKKDPYFESFLFLHEVMHLFLPQDLPLRRVKHLSMVNALRDNFMSRMRPDVFALQMEQNQIAFVSSTEQLERDLTDAQKLDFRFVLTAKDIGSPEYLVAAHRLSSQGAIAKLQRNGMSRSDEDQINRAVQTLHAMLRDLNMPGTTDTKALETLKMLDRIGFSEGIDAQLNLAIQNNWADTLRYLLLDRVAESAWAAQNDVIFLNVLATKNQTLLKEFLNRPNATLPKAALFDDYFPVWAHSGDTYQAILGSPKVSVNIEVSVRNLKSIRSDAAIATSEIFVDQEDGVRFGRYSSDTDGNNVDITPLMYAVLSQNDRLLGLLLSDSRVDVNKQTKLGDTALSFAILKGNAEYVRRILAHPDVDPNVLSRRQMDFIFSEFFGKSVLLEGVTPLMFALQMKRSDLIDLLLKHPKIQIDARAIREKVYRVQDRRVELVEVRPGTKTAVDMAWGSQDTYSIARKLEREIKMRSRKGK